MVVQNKVLEQLEEDIHAGRDFVLQARRREAGLDGAAAARDSTFDIQFRCATEVHNIEWRHESAGVAACSCV